MAIQNRRGFLQDLDPDKLLPGEWAVTLDDGELHIYMCFAPGVTKRMSTYEDMLAEIQDGIGLGTAELKGQYLAEILEIQSQIEANQNNVNENTAFVGSFKNLLEDTYIPNIEDAVASTSSDKDQAGDYAATSRRYAVGGVAEGDAEDNAKYYKEKAQFYADYAEMVTDVSIATETKPGIMKGAGDLQVDADGVPYLRTEFFPYMGNNPVITSGDSLVDILGKMAGVQGQIGKLRFYTEDDILCIDDGEED